MVKDILAKIDAEIARIEQARALLSVSGAVSAKRKPGRPAKVATVTPKVQKTRKRRKMSAEGRERVRQAQIKRSAALKGASKANLNATVAPLPNANRKAAKAA
jgi:nitroreductase